jgi:hypothetical protein
VSQLSRRKWHAHEMPLNRTRKLPVTISVPNVPKTPYDLCAPPQPHFPRCPPPQLPPHPRALPSHDRKINGASTGRALPQPPASSSLSFRHKTQRCNACGAPVYENSCLLAECRVHGKVTKASRRMQGVDLAKLSTSKAQIV